MSGGTTHGLKLLAQNFELEARARTLLTASNIHHENARSELRTPFDENRMQLIEYLGQEFEEKLQWEENEYYCHLTSEEQQYEVADLEDQNAELIAEANSVRSLLTIEQNVPVNQVGLSESSKPTAWWCHIIGFS